MANTTWKQVVYDVADGIRTLLGTSSTIPVGDLKGKLTGITRKSAATYTPSTSAQTIAAGQYLAGAQTIAAMPSGALSNISVSSAGLITGQVGTSGYLASGTKKTKQLTTQAAKTITPSTSSQTAVASGVYTTGAVTVSAVPTETKTVVPSSTAQTVTPSSGKFLSKVTVNAADMSSVDIVNGVIEEYYSSSGTISAGTFVEFVNNAANSAGTGTITKTSSTGYAYKLKATKLSSTKVLIIFSNTTDTSYSIIYGLVCTISGTTITSGTVTEIQAYNSSSSIYYPGANFNVEGLSETSALLVYTRSTLYYIDYYHLYSVVLSISGTTITVNTIKSLTTTNHIGAHLHCVKLDSSRVLMLYGGSSGPVYGNVITVSGTSITLATDLSIVSSVNTAYDGDGEFRGTLLSNGNIFVVYLTDTNIAYGVVLTASGTTLSKGTALLLATKKDMYAGNQSIALASSGNSVLFVYGALETIGADTSVYGVYCTVSGTEISIVQSSLIQQDAHDYSLQIIAQEIGDNVIAVSYGSATTSVPIKLIQLTSAGMEIISTITASLSTLENAFYYLDMIKLDDGSIYYAFNNNNYSDNMYELYGVIINADLSVTIKSATSKIQGVTASAATTTSTGKVWVLE